MQPSQAKYFEQGFIVLGTSLSGGSAILQLTSFSPSVSVDVQELLSFENNRAKAYSPNFSSWTADVEGYFTQESGASQYHKTGNTYVAVTGGSNATQLLDAVLAKRTDNKLMFEFPDGTTYGGDVILTEWGFTGSAGEVSTFSLSIQGSGELQKLST